MTRDQLEDALDCVGMDESDRAYVLMKFDQSERHETMECPGCGNTDCKIVVEYRCNACKGEYFQLFGKATSEDIASSSSSPAEPVQQDPKWKALEDAEQLAADIRARREERAQRLGLEPVQQDTKGKGKV